MIYKNNNILIEQFVTGDLMTNCYIAIWKATGDAVVIDPGAEADRIFEALKQNGARVTAIVNTHGHGDHIGANGDLKALTGAPIYIGAADAEMLTDPEKNLSRPFGFDIYSPPADRILKAGDTVGFGEGKLKVLETPGHSPGSISLVGQGFVFVGDLLFEGSIGRTDFLGGNYDELIRNIREKIFPLGDDCVVFSGHGNATTVGAEKRSNPFLAPGLRPVW